MAVDEGNNKEIREDRDICSIKARKGISPSLALLKIQDVNRTIVVVVRNVSKKVYFFWWCSTDRRREFSGLPEVYISLYIRIYVSFDRESSSLFFEKIVSKVTRIVFK